MTKTRNRVKGSGRRGMGKQSPRGYRRSSEGDPPGQNDGRGLDLDCYVLADGRRVFHKRGRPSVGMKSARNVFLRAVQRKGLGSEIDKELFKRLRTPLFLSL